MINKYSGVTLIFLAIVSLVASWMIYKKYTKRFYVSPNNAYESRQLIKDIAIKPEAFASLDVMQNVMNKLSEQSEVKGDHVTIALSPVINIDERPLVTVPTDKEKQRRRAAAICRKAKSFNVSMSYISGDEKYAVISDKFVREGQELSGNYKVLNISADKVKVQKYGVKCDIDVSSSRISKL